MNIKVAMVSTSDLGHGAGVSSYNLLQDFVAVPDIDARMFVAEKKSDSSYVTELASYSGVFGRSLMPILSNVEKYINLYGPQNYYSTYSKSLVREFDKFKPQVVNLHSIHWDRKNFSPEIIKKTKGVPIIWTLHDMWAFTGHCCYSDDCELWRNGCGNCKRLSPFIPIKRDATATLMKIKKRWYENKKLTIVAPSVWLYNLARESYLFEDVDVRCIPYSVDQKVFYKKEISKKRKELFGDSKVILFSCSWLQDPRKGFEDFCLALGQIKSDLSNIVVAVAGSGWIPRELKKTVKVIFLGEVSSRNFMNDLYNMADFFVMPTKMDNLPNAILESLAAGLPVVAYNTGGIPDMIKSGMNGIVIDKGDIVALSRAIQICLNDQRMLEKFSECAVETISSQFTSELQSQRYQSLFEEKINE